MDIMGLMKKAGAMQAKMAEMQAELDNVTVEGLSGGGLVKVTLTAKGALQGLSIDPSLLKEDEKEILEDLIVAAHADAQTQGGKPARREDEGHDSGPRPAARHETAFLRLCHPRGRGSRALGQSQSLDGRLKTPFWFAPSALRARF